MYRIKDDVTGQRFERLLAVERIVKNRRGYYRCICDCGNEVIVRADILKNGRAKSCGCYTRDRAKKGDIRRVHGKHGTRLYWIWLGIHARCNTKTNPAYKNYGGRGIAVCDEWLEDFQSFYDWAMANGYEDTLTIERKNVNGNYEPSNCCWIPREEQAGNTRANRKITYNGETYNLSEWARKVGISQSLIRWRLNHDWTLEKALTTKPKTTL